ncbi:MAG TPA: PH domain-containing protein [Chitinophagales bacterium]|nr:PH domain-containing protein [Chitinophagales bacterium]
MGHYINSNLVKNEHVELETSYHWIIFCSFKAIFSLFTIPLIARYTDEFAVTNKRVIIKTGLISRKTFEMNHSKIESVNVDQSILGRILGYGSLSIVGSGGTKEVFPNIKSPLEFRKKFQEMSI